MCFRSLIRWLFLFWPRCNGFWIERRSKFFISFLFPFFFFIRNSMELSLGKWSGRLKDWILNSKEPYLYKYERVSIFSKRIHICGIFSKSKRRKIIKIFKIPKNVQEFQDGLSSKRAKNSEIDSRILVI